MKYEKQYLSLDDQVALLKSRRLIVANDGYAKDCLGRIGYFRLSPYWFPFQKIEGGTRTNNFLDNSTFEDVLKLYAFDKKFKLLLLDAIESIEIAVRVETALLIGAKHPFAHIQHKHFHSKFFNLSSGNGRTIFDDWRDECYYRAKDSDNEFVEQYLEKYTDEEYLPIWMDVELWDFGTLIHLYEYMKESDRQDISNRFGIRKTRVFESWLKSLKYVRNAIAHHGRLWNLNIVRVPALPQKDTSPEFDQLLSSSPTFVDAVVKKTYFICCIASYFMRKIDSSSTWSTELRDLCLNFPAMPHANISHMGFPADWEKSGFWQ